MARRMKYKGAKKSKNAFKPKKKNPGEKLRKPMLNLGRLDYFKYDLNEIVNNSEINEDLQPSFKASLMAKARQMSINDAKDYLEDMKRKEEITEDVFRSLCKLLDRYTRVR